MLSKRFLPYFLITLLSGLATPQLVAQSIKLDKPTRTVYKCNTDGKVVYSDTPCLGAERIDAEPTRGLDKSSGASRVGSDVAAEMRRELMDEAIKPLTGMSSMQMDIERRRFNLPPESKHECKILDASIGDTEAKERTAQGSARLPLQQNLFELRKRFKELKC